MSNTSYEAIYQTIQQAPRPVEVIIDLMKNTPLPEGTQVERTAIRHIPAAWITPPKVDEQRTLAYFHGGGYTKGGIETHLGLVGHIAQAARSRALLIEYRLAPKHPFPAAVNDCHQSVLWLYDKGINPEKMCIAGDSAGGGLALAVAQKLKTQGRPLPATLVCLSPWVDLTNSGETMETRAKADPWLNKTDLDECAQAYIPHQNHRHPLASPLFADLTGLPPLLVMVGTREVLLADSRRLVEKARSSGVLTTLVVGQKMIHVWPLLVTRIPEAEDAIQDIGAFVIKH
jgi:acetyl esterase/lipase